MPLQAPPATPVSVAVVEQRDVAMWDEFSGRLEAVERVEVRSRVAGAVQAVHFREGALVKQGDLLVTIDPGALRRRGRARRGAGRWRPRRACRFTKSELERGQQLLGLARHLAARPRPAHQRASRSRGQPARRQGGAAVGAAESRLHPGARAGRRPRRRLEITVGNLVAAGPGAPVLTTLVSVNPIYASFDADEEVVMRALQRSTATARAHAQIERIPVQMTTATSNGTPFQGQLQLIDNQVDAAQRHGARARRVRQPGRRA